jgi:hypothetical protein
MTRPRRYLARMLILLLAVAVAIAALAPQLGHAFMGNAPLNGLIVGILILGIAYVFRQVIMLNAEVAWLENFRAGRNPASSQNPPRLLAPMAAMLRERSGGRLTLSATSARSVLDGIASRLDESRDIARYLTGLLIFLGLLGTFWGLIQVVQSIAGVIGGMTVNTGDLAVLFDNLKRGLEAPLSGMGTAFSASLFGLAGSLILGFLDLQAGQAQNRFYNDLEEWLAGQTRLSSGALQMEGDQSVPAYVQALLEQTADSLESLQRTLNRGEEARIASNASITTLADRLGVLTDQMRTEQSLMVRLAENQLELKPILAKLADVGRGGGLGDDETTRTHIRNIDVYMARLIEELATGRAELVEELRTEIRVLSRTLAAMSGGERPATSSSSPLRARRD